MNVSDRMDIQGVLQQMRQMKQAAGVEADVAAAPTRVGDPNRAHFGELLTDAIDQVNSLQKESSRLSTALTEGDPGVTLTETMIASQKASVAFQAVTEVRNKLVSAYETIRSMPI